MENVFIISDASDWLNYIIADLGLSNIVSFKNYLDTDEDIDVFVKTYIPNSINCLLMPMEFVQSDVNKSLKIAMHLRLLPNDDQRRMVPILFLSEKSEIQIRLLARNQIDNNYLEYLLGTEGIDLLTPELESIIPVIENIQKLTKESYKFGFYNRIKILPSESIGNHSIANIWGAYRLASITGNISNIIENKIFKEHASSLYFKYLTAFSDVKTNQNSKNNSIINVSGKKILLIDDEEDKGWSDVLKNIFFDAEFEFIAAGVDFIERATAVAVENNSEGLPKWDLILLDLRLDNREDIGNNSNQLASVYSGATLLKKIKATNAGIQVIMFTASNKAWNMRELLDMGANGFYIKESPEYSLDEDFSKRNYNGFELQIISCLENYYIKKIFQRTRILKNISLKEDNKLNARCQNKKTIEDIRSFKFISKIKLDTALALISQLNKNPQYIEYVIFNYIQILEDYCNLFTKYNKNIKNFYLYKNLEDLMIEKNKIEVTKLNENSELVFSQFEPIKNYYPFLKNTKERDKHFIDYKFKDCELSSNKFEISFSFKLASILYYQLGSLKDLPFLMELIYIRNNKIVHSGNFDASKRKFENVDFFEPFNIIYQLINKIF